MDFIHRPDQLHKTIAAIATPPGVGAISVIRLSGKEAFKVAAAIFSGPVASYLSHTAHYGKILGKEGHVIDSVLLLVMRAPRSYTGEDTVEIFCHGGSLVTRRVFARVLEAGASPAEPGEFSLRAFLNGKLDLTQAEAVEQLISAKSELALLSAEKQLEGVLSRTLRSYQKELTDVAAIVEAWVDFPEEGLEFASFEELVQTLSCMCQKMEALRDTFYEGKPLNEGIALCLVGTPNVGKSSLMNALLRSERAIVSPQAGTTRDLLHEDLRLGLLPIRLIDTAGIRSTHEEIEQEGIRRSKRTIETADLILLILDASRPLSADDQNLLEVVPPSKTIVVWNKIDLSLPRETVAWPHQVLLSAEKKIGLDRLYRAIEKLLWKEGPPSKEELFIVQERHFQALDKALLSCRAAIAHLQAKSSPELISIDLRETLQHLGSILGTNVTEDILSAIFSKFCVGK